MTSKFVVGLLLLLATASLGCASASHGDSGRASAALGGAAGKDGLGIGGADVGRGRGAGGGVSGDGAGAGGADVGSDGGAAGGDVSNAGDGAGPSASSSDAPDEEQALIAFLTARSYASWPKEAEAHPSAGPHGNSVRVYYGPKAARALHAGAATFPAGAAAVKELERDGSLYGWSVWVKVEDASEDGNGFFWYERTERADGSVSVSGNGLGDRNCVGCHRAGKDFDLSTLPFG